MEIYDRAVLYRSVPCKTLPRPRVRTRNCPRLWAASARATETLLRGHGGSSAALVVQQEDAIRNAAGPFDTGVREYSEKELACSGSEATEGKSELSDLMICFAALLMAGVRLICLAGRRRFRMPLRLTTRGLPGRRPFRNAWAPARKGFSPGQEPPVPAEAPPMHSPGQDAGYRGCAENEAGPGLTRSRP